MEKYDEVINEILNRTVEYADKGQELYHIDSAFLETNLNYDDSIQIVKYYYHIAIIEE